MILILMKFNEISDILENISNNTHNYSNDSLPNMSCSSVKSLNSSISIDNNENDLRK